MITGDEKWRYLAVRNMPWLLRGISLNHNRGVATRGPGDQVLPTSISEPNKVQNIKDITFYGCLGIIRAKYFTSSIVYTTIFGQFTAAFHFISAQGKWITSCWTFWKGPILNTGPSEKFLLWTIRKKTTMKESLTFYYRRNPGPTEKVL